MRDTSELEKQILSLPHEERERLALAVWSSLEEDFQRIGLKDAEGIAMARNRDREVEITGTQTLNHSEFRHRTGNAGDED